MVTSRIKGASEGCSQMVEATPVGWIVVGLMFVTAFFLIGYLVRNHLERTKQEERRRARRREKMASKSSRDRSKVALVR